MAAFILLVFVAGQPRVLGQPDVPACPQVTLPVQSMVRSPGDLHTSADCSLAVGLYRIATSSNNGVRLHCKEGGPKTGQVPLNGADLNTALFVQSPGFVESDFNLFFDTRVIYDPFSSPPRFWVISAERGDSGMEPDLDKPAAVRGRIHVAVSTTDAPETFGTAYWHKYTSDTPLPTGASGPSFYLNDPALGNFLGQDYLDPIIHHGKAFADRPSAAVDENYLYIATREGIVNIFHPDNPWDDRTLMIAIPKQPMLSGQATSIEKTMWIDNTGDSNQTWGHELAVDFDGVNDGVSKVYMLALPRLHATPAFGSISPIQFPDLLLGAFYKEGGVWKYKSKLVNLNNDGFPNNKFRGVQQLAPGGGGDTNYISFGLFWSCCTRTVGNPPVKKIWAVHHVRDYSDGPNSTVSRVQYYEVDPGTFPATNATPPKFTQVRRLLPPVLPNAAWWAYDPAIAVSSSGDLTVFFTRAGPANDQTKYPDMWFWNIIGGSQSAGLVKAGPNQYYNPGTPFWLDFSGAAPDPVDSCAYWGHSITDLDIDQWQSWLAQYNACSKRSGDQDGDGDCDVFDFLLFLKRCETGDVEADLNYDGFVDALDAVQFQEEARQ